jgi:hypothetical protein
VVRTYFDRFWGWSLMVGWVAIILYALWQVFR